MAPAKSRSDNLDSDQGKKNVQRKPKCSRCRNHGENTNLKGHTCKFQECKCQYCFLIVERKRIMAAEVSHRRAQVQDALHQEQKIAKSSSIKSVAFSVEPVSPKNIEMAVFPYLEHDIRAIFENIWNIFFDNDATIIYKDALLLILIRSEVEAQPSACRSNLQIENTILRKIDDEKEGFSYLERDIRGIFENIWNIFFDKDALLLILIRSEVESQSSKCKSNLLIENTILRKIDSAIDDINEWNSSPVAEPACVQSCYRCSAGSVNSRFFLPPLLKCPYNVPYCCSSTQKACLQRHTESCFFVNRASPMVTMQCDCTNWQTKDKSMNDAGNCQLLLSALPLKP